MSTYTEKRTYFADRISEEIKSSSDFLYNLMLIFILCLAMMGIIWIKSRNFINFSGDYLLLAYATFITGFQLFRLTSALFYKHSFDRIVSSVDGKALAINYEPYVTCVIPCKNEEKAIATTIRKCYEAHYPKEKLEIIVINDGSTDNTGKIIDNLKATEFPDLKVVHWAKNRGKREGMYAGFKMATGDIILQLDSDSYIIPHTFRQLIEPFRNSDIGAVCAHADPANADDNWISKMQAAYYFMAFRILKAAESTFGIVFCCSGCSSAYRKSVVLPLLDEWLAESFMGQKVTWGDDRALTSYVIKSGHKTIYTDKAKAVTIVPSNFRQLMTQQTRWKKSWIINAFFTGKFIWKTDPYIAFLYYYPLIILSILTPIMAFRAVVYTPLFANISSLQYYIMGGLILTVLLIVFCKFIDKEFRHWPYLFLWSILNIFILSFLLFYAAATLNNRSWGTR